MEVKAKVKYIRMSPRKVRLVADIIRGMKIEQALDQLTFVNKKATNPLAKLVNSAIANAVNNFDLEKDNLFVKTITVNEGPTLKRWLPRAHGRATPIRKRTCHVDLVLGELKDSGKTGPKKQKVEEPIKLDKSPKHEAEIKLKTAKTKKAKDVVESGEVPGDNIVDPRMEGRGHHAKIEGKGTKGFAGKIFRRKSG